MGIGEVERKLSLTTGKMLERTEKNTQMLWNDTKILLNGLKASVALNLDYQETDRIWMDSEFREKRKEKKRPPQQVCKLFIQYDFKLCKTYRQGAVSAQPFGLVLRSNRKFICNIIISRRHLPKWIHAISLKIDCKHSKRHLFCHFAKSRATSS